MADRTLPNYGDFPFLANEIARLARTGRPVLCITGDVHWGRVVRARNQYLEPGMIYEIISSPTSLVTTVGSDPLRRFGAGLRAVFGGDRDPWPRHADPEKPPKFLARSELGRRYVCEKTLESQKGNHVTLLSFRRHGTGLEMNVTFREIPADGSAALPKKLGPISLKPLA